jgi:hypothetical protein
VENELEIELNRVSRQSIAKAIEALRGARLQVTQRSDDFVHGRLVDHTVWSPDKKPGLFYELDIGWEFHISAMRLVEITPLHDPKRKTPDNRTLVP